MNKIQIVGIYIEKDKRILMVQEKGQAWGLWTVPVGHVESGESLAEGAIREAKEETGYDVKIIKELESLTINGSDYKGGIKDNDKEIEIHFFEGEIIGGELEINKNKHLDVRWFDKEEIDKLPLRGSWLRNLLDVKETG